jgi:hypothetical protein
MNPTLVRSAAWASAWAVVLWQRLLLPLLLLALDSLKAAPRQSQPTPAPRPRLTPVARFVEFGPPSLDVERMTCAQLRELAGTSRHLSKRQLIARIKAIRDERNYG